MEGDRGLAAVRLTLAVVDGSLLSALPWLVQAMWLKEHTASGLVKWRWHAQFVVERFMPTRIDVTPRGGGGHDERDVLSKSLLGHLLTRWYANRL